MDPQRTPLTSEACSCVGLPRGRIDRVSGSSQRAHLRSVSRTGAQRRHPHFTGVFQCRPTTRNCRPQRTAAPSCRPRRVSYRTFSSPPVAGQPATVAPRPITDGLVRHAQDYGWRNRATRVTDTASRLFPTGRAQISCTMPHTGVRFGKSDRPSGVCRVLS